jgi:hypothetical protein
MGEAPDILSRPAQRTTVPDNLSRSRAVATPAVVSTAGQKGMCWKLAWKTVAKAWRTGHAHG